MHTQQSSLMHLVIRPSIVAIVVFTLITGVLYPALITGMAQLLFPMQANGSLLTAPDGRVVGSALVGQEFNAPGYFWGRLSATSPVPYNAAASSGSNLGPLNPALIGADGTIQVRIDALRAADAAAGVRNDAPIPVDLVTASGSGLDPHISPAAARYQVARVATMRQRSAAEIQAIVDDFTEGRTLGVLGEPRVNVLRLNLVLDDRYPIRIQ
jgi:potassium-transporting ATPase KdpC subunit